MQPRPQPPRLPLFRRVLRVEVVPETAALLLASAEVTSEGERCDDGRRYLGSTLATIDLAPLAHRFEERPDARAAALLARLGTFDPVLGAALESLALAEARRRLGAGHALAGSTVEKRGEASDLVLRFTMDVDARVVPSDATAARSFTAAEVEAIVGVPRRRLRAWAHTGFLLPSAPPCYTFLDLVRLKTAWGLVSAGVPLARVRASLASLAAQLPEEPDPLAQLRIVAVGEEVVVERAGEASFEAESGQRLLDFGLAELAGAAPRPR